MFVISTLVYSSFSFRDVEGGCSSYPVMLKENGTDTFLFLSEMISS